MKKKKQIQFKLTNPKGAGRPSSIDPGIRHTRRELLLRASSLHLTIKVRKNKADIRTKTLLKALHHAIKRARLKKLKVIHYTLEHDHLHLLIETPDNKILHAGMQALGISLSKAINRIKNKKGAVYKHRYHFRKINSTRELKNVINYIFNNGIRHRRSMNQIDPYNSKVVDTQNSADIKKIIARSRFLTGLRDELLEVLDIGVVFCRGLSYL